VSLAFNSDAVAVLFAAMLSTAARLSVFDRTPIAHEPRNAPGAGKSFALWWGRITPYPRGSGMAAVSGVVTFHGRIYKSLLSKPEDDIDPDLLNATCALIAAYSGGFTLGETVLAVDLLGMSGQVLDAQPAYLEQDGKHFRIAELTIPVIISDMWTEVP